MRISRRRFIELAAATGVATSLPWKRVYANAHSPMLRKFIQPLPGLGPGGIPVATAIPFMGADYYQLEAGEFTQQLHPQLPPTTLWGYADATTGIHRHLGPVIVAQRGTPVRITLTNLLPPVHPLPVDVTIPGAELPQNRVSLHLHGGFVPWISDGGPFAWFTPGGSYGPSAISVPDMGAPPVGALSYYYPNDQSARLMWYHDHALGITRLNAYAGLASAYVLRDEEESRLIASGAIPSNEIPLAVQDKRFKRVADQWGQPGDLWYPSEYDAEVGPSQFALPPVSVVPEFMGDTMLVNGVVYPTVKIEQRRYRLRVLNACNARFLRLRLFYAQGSTFPMNTEADLKKPGPRFLQIGTEAGFLPKPVGLAGRGDSDSTLLLGPGERADLIANFSEVPAGSILILYNDAPSPFPSGDEDDFHEGSREEEERSRPGYGPNTRTLLQVVVGARVGAQDRSAPLTLPSLDPAPIVPPGVTTLPPGIVTRELTLNEDFDAFGRLLQRQGTTESIYPGTFGRNFEDPATEMPTAGSVEAWRIFNLTADTHPIHFHLLNVQVVSRQKIHPRQLRAIGPARPPEPNERGWKETVRMNPGECTTVVARFDLPIVPFAVPPSPRTGGNEYVWHCHILEHEEHDMMRPLIVR